MKTIATFLVTGFLASLSSCTYYEDEPSGISSTTRDTTTTVTDYGTGESTTTRKTTTHYPE